MRGHDREVAIAIAMAMAMAMAIAVATIGGPMSLLTVDLDARREDNQNIQG